MVGRSISLGPRTVRERPPHSVLVCGTYRLCSCLVVYLLRESSLFVGRYTNQSGNTLFFTLKTVTATSKITFFISFKPLELCYEGSGVVRLPGAPRTDLCRKVLQLLHPPHVRIVGCAIHLKAVINTA